MSVSGTYGFRQYTGSLVRGLGERLGWLGHVTSSGICNLMSRAVLESARAS